MTDIKTVGEKYVLYNANNKVIIDSFGAKVLAFYQNDYNRLFYNSEDIGHSGIPLCFPNFGPLVNNVLSTNGKKYSMKQHGFIRNMNFSFVSKTVDSLLLKLESNDETLINYPFEFVFSVEFILLENELEICFNWNNKSDEKSPLSPGVHPYFSVYDKENIILQTNSITYNLSQDFSEIERLVDSKFLDAATRSSFIIKGAPDINLISHNLENTKVLLGNNKSVNLEYDNLDFDRLTVWRKSAFEDYICIEPANTQNKINDNPILVEANREWKSKVIIKF